MGNATFELEERAGGRHSLYKSTDFISRLSYFINYRRSILRDGSYQTNCPEVYWREGSQEAASHQGCQEECSQHWWRQEAPQIQAWHGCSAGNSTLPEVYRTVDQKASLPKTGA